MTDTSRRVAAVDLGATSVRVCVCDLSSRPLMYEVVHRVTHTAQPDRHGTLRWEWGRIMQAVIDGLTIAAREPLASVGVDAWGVDYGMIDADGRLLAEPACYRDARTDGFADTLARIGPKRLYEIAGLQNLPFNTIFQLAVEDRALLSDADRLLMLPELVVHHLTGVASAEITSAGTTGLVDQQTRTWSDELIDAISVPRRLFTELREPGSPVGTWRGVPVHLVAGHDTGSAVVGIGADRPNPAFVATGTWLLAGVELDGPMLTKTARAGSFTNEYGPGGTTRYLRNIAGFWLLEQCRKEWGDAPVDALLAESSQFPEITVGFDATDPRFLGPDSMLTEVCDAAGLPVSSSRGAVVSAILNALAQSTVDVLTTARATSTSPPQPVHVIGGGVRATPFIDRLRDRLDVPLIVGAAESAALGNAMVQGVALGVFDDVADARKALVP